MFFILGFGFFGYAQEVVIRLRRFFFSFEVLDGVCYRVLLGFYWVGWTRTDQIRSDADVNGECLLTVIFIIGNGFFGYA